MSKDDDARESEIRVRLIAVEDAERLDAWLRRVLAEALAHRERKRRGDE